MLLVIFGAGASYDSVPHFPPLPAPVEPQREEFRPPLANQLFDDRPMFMRTIQQYSACKPLIPLLRTGVPVEQQLAKFEDQAKTFPERHRQLTAIRFYLHYALWDCQQHWGSLHRGITNYVTFLDEIERWRYLSKQSVCFVTFNYDTMLEEAMHQVLGRGIADFDSYISATDYKLVKLHGSTDWGLEIESSTPFASPSEIIASAANLRLSTRFLRVANYPMRFADGKYGFPALSIPVQKKDEFMCPPVHVEALAGVILEVNKIITIGWRATEDKFLKMLRKPLTGLRGDVDLMVVSGTNAGALETTKNLGMDTPSPRKRALIDTGFSGLVRTLPYLESFLT